MGERDIRDQGGPDALRAFTRLLLQDLRAFQKMVDDDLFERGVRRLGAEQEIFLVDEVMKAAPRSAEVLEALGDPQFTTELGRFNLEFNLEPVELGPSCLAAFEKQISASFERLRSAAEGLGCRPVLCGILPTIEKSDLGLDNMTPLPRYFAINEAMTRIRGADYQFRIQGRDELIISHDNVMLEACNTSFQVHFQVSVREFARCYNIAQVLAAPVLAAATNSPLLFGRQLWRETRIALFEQSVDTRLATSHPREAQGRVSFGQHWVESSPVEIFKEDISRFRVLLSADVEEDPFDVLARGEVPALTALRLHNGTVYRWNRPCYGVYRGEPHLRIENRVLPAGPTVVDEVANAALWFGLMAGMMETYEDVTRILDFAAARENFVSAARLGLGATLEWPGRGQVLGRELLLEVLLPMAREGLVTAGVDHGQADHYLGVVEDRVRSGQTGSQWLIDSATALRETGSRAEVLRALVAVSIKGQTTGRPIHEWPLATLEQAGPLKRRYDRVEELMTTDLFTVTEEEVVDMVASVMDWRHVRRIPVEDDQHRLVGLVTYRNLLRVLSESLSRDGASAIPVRDIMERDIITVAPDTPALAAMRLMREKQVGCLPVIDRDRRLVGILTEHDFMEIARPLLEQEFEGR